ncbi:MAG: VWA domain-containing protein [Myxococcota bacterium]
MRWISIAVLVCACSDVGIQFQEPEPPITYDNRLRVLGEHCVQPDNSLEFPVKVLLVVDQSASFQCTDSRDRRFDALRRALDQLLSQRSVSVGMVGFSSWARAVPFTRERGDLNDLFLDGGGSATDYQGALAAVAATLENDMIMTPRGERARTRYVTVFLSDGSPEPQCRAGCEDGESVNFNGFIFEGTCANGEDDDGDGQVDGADIDCQDEDLLDPAFSPCNFRGRSDLPDGIEDDEYIDFSGVCPDYNQPPQLEQRVRDIMELQDIYDVGGISLNTVLIFSPQDVVNSVCTDAAEDEFGFDRVDASMIMQGMAREGRGLFRDIDISADSTDFLEFDFRPLIAPQWLSGLVVSNQHSRPLVEGYGPDTDSDGIADEYEERDGTNPRMLDSDEGGGDGYSDGLETRLSESGFDPLNASDPPIACADSDDTDGDGLLNCEEEALETDIRLADTDSDQMSDWLEVINGLDPTTPDADLDLDFDGILNREEIQAGTDPSRPDPERYRFERQTYRVDDLGRREIDRDERQCYGFDVQNVQLVETPVVGARGLNRVLVYAHEQPAMLSGSDGLTYVACFEAFYNGETDKVPEDGVIDASQEGWTELLTALQTGVDSLASCAWLPEDFGRGRLNSEIRDCLPETVVLGRFQYTNDEARDLLNQYIARNRGMTMPLEAWRLFNPIESFNPDSDCVRPWEMERVLELFAQFEAACACTPPESEDDPPLSPCCM